MSSERRLPGLDLLRAIAILWVMLFHARSLGIPLGAIASYGWMGVDLFFVLSGYLIGSQLLKPYMRGESPSISRFYLSRALRILPAYAVVLIVYYALPTFREEPGISPWWYFVTFTQNLLIDYEKNRAFSHAWSLCVEEHFYLLFPLLTAALMIRPTLKKTIFLIGVLLLLGTLIRAFAWDQMLPRPGVLYVEKIYYPTYTRLDGLLIGVLLASMKVFRPEWWRRCLERGNAILFSGLVVFAAAVWTFTPRLSFGGNTVGFPLLALAFGLLLIASVSKTSLIGKYRIPGAGLFATLAYSLYLTHKQVIHLDRLYLSEWIQPGSFLSLLFLLASALAASAVLYLIVERPFLRLRDKLFAKYDEIPRAVSVPPLPQIR